MLLRPKKTKFRKAHKGRICNLYKSKQRLVYGDSGIMCEEACRVTAAQLAAVTLALKRKMKKDGQIRLRVFPHIPVSGKPSEIRMGKGKGGIKYWMARVRPGSMLLEITTKDKGLAKIALEIGRSKLGFKTKSVFKPLPLRSYHAQFP